MSTSNTGVVTPIEVTKIRLRIVDGEQAYDLELTGEQARALYAELSKLYGSSWVPTPQPPYTPCPWYPTPSYPWTPSYPIVTCNAHNSRR